MKDSEVKRVLWRRWYGMKYRCYNPLSRAYFCYGARGIKLSDEWLKFENFYNDMKDTFIPGLEIDRIDGTTNYCKENCRWLSREENLRNKGPKYLPRIKGWYKQVEKAKKKAVQKIESKHGIPILEYKIQRAAHGYKTFCGENIEWLKNKKPSDINSLITKDK